MSGRPISFDAPGRFLVYAHTSAPTLYAEEEHDAVQICIPFPNASYTVRRQSETGGALLHRLGPQDVLAIPAGQPHEIAWRRTADVVSLMVSHGFIAQALGVEFLELQDGFIIRDSFISAAAGQMKDVLETTRPSLAMVESLATAIAYRIGVRAGDAQLAGQREADAAPLTSQQMAALDDYVDARLGEDLSLEVLARNMGMSLWHFGRRLRATTGLSPHAFITNRRFTRAQQLLAGTTLSILDVAIEVGMTHSHFSRTFLRRFGVQPSEYRRQTAA